MSDFKSSIHKYGNNLYRVDYSYIDPITQVRKRTCKRGFKLSREATAWQKNELPDIIKQLETLDYETPDELLTMGELIEEYMEFSSLRREESTVGTKSHIIDTKILPYFKDRIVFDITPKDILKWENYILGMRKANGEEYAETYKHTICNQLWAIFNYAETFHNLPKTPTSKVEKLGSKERETEAEVWEIDEYLKFSAMIQDKPLYFYAFEVFYWTGIRLGELLALTKADVDCKAKTLRVINSYSKAKKEKGKTKNVSSKRTVHMPTELAEELQEYMDSLYDLQDTDVLFPISKSQLHRVVKENSAKAGVKRLTIHEFRHSHISLLMNSNCGSILEIAKRAGHAKPDMTLLYSHLYKNRDQIIARRLEDIMKEGKLNVSEEQRQETAF